MSDIILQDPMYLCSNKDYVGLECRVSLSPTALHIMPLKEQFAKKARTLKLEDVIGCLCMKHQQTNENVHHLQNLNVEEMLRKTSVFLNLYSYILSKDLRGLTRKRDSVLLRYSTHLSFEKNSADIARWQSNIYFLIHNPFHVTMVKNQEAQEALISPRVLVFVNPNSGTGTAAKAFNARVRSFLGEANISYDLIVTTHTGHCKTAVKECSDLLKYAGIVTVSGDGLPFEVYNGLLERQDWETTCKLPIGVIPQGSGNGLARSLAHFNGEPYSKDPLTVSILNVVKLRTKEIDLCMINIGPNSTKACSFLSIGWGLMADIDIESERLRMIGEARFTVWAVARVFSLRTYKATLYYLPVERVPSSSTFPLLPPLAEPIPVDQGWVTERGDFVCLYSSMVPFISTDLYFAPEAKLGDGVLWLMIVKGPVTKIQLIQLLLLMDNGGHTRLPWLTFLPVRAFRLLPENSTGHKTHLTIDGEKFNSQVMQAEVMPRQGRVFSR